MWLQAINVFASQLLITLREIGGGLLEIIQEVVEIFY